MRIKLWAVGKTILRKLWRAWSWLLQSISQPTYTGKGTHGMKEMVMAKVIEFYIPQDFKNSRKWVPQPQLAKILEFRQSAVKSA